MNYITPQRLPVAEPQETRAFVWLPELVAFLRRRWLVVAVVFAAALGLATVYLAIATPNFAAVAKLVIDPSNSDPFKQIPITIGDSSGASAFVDSQIEILQSHGLADRVVRSLHLADDAQFQTFGRSLMGTVLGIFDRLFPSDAAFDDGQRIEATTQLLMRLYDVRRVGLSYVLELQVKTPNAGYSARLANAIADAYLADGVDAKRHTATQAESWLKAGISEVRGRALQADQALLAFREANRLVNLDKMTVSEQQLAELSTNLAAAQSKLSEARARAGQIDTLLQSGIGDPSVSDAIQNQVIIRLRQQYLDAVKRVTELGQRYGQDHVAVQRARQEADSLQAAGYSELQRIAQGYHSDMDVAAANVAAVKRDYDAQMQTTASSQTLLAQARDLESSATIYRSLYQNFLQRYTQALQDQTFPVPQARVFTPATPPLKKSTPKGLMVLGIGGVLGLGLGLAAAFVRDEFDVGIRSARDASRAAGTDCIAVLPRVRQPLQTSWALRMARGAVLPEAGGQSAIPPAFAEGLQAVSARLVTRRQRHAAPLVIGVTSAIAGEGKTVVAANLALLLAASEQRTVLVDMELRGTSLSRLIAPGAAAGWQEQMRGTAGLDALVMVDPASGLHVLPAERIVAAVQAGMLLGSDAMPVLIDALRGRYTNIILDLPAALPYADVQLLQPVMDEVLLVVAWGTTDRDAVEECAARGLCEAGRVLGVVLNKAPAKVAAQVVW